MYDTDKTLILPSYVDDKIKAKLERMSFQSMKDHMIDACKAMGSDGVDASTLEMVITNIPKEPSQEENMALVYEALEQFCDSVDKYDPEKTVYKEKYNDIAADYLDDIQSGLFHMLLKIKFAEGYDYVRVCDSMRELEAKDRIEGFQNEIKGFKDLLHVALEGICSGSVGPDEIENAIATMYMLFEQIADHGEEIKEEYFS